MIHEYSIEVDEASPKDVLKLSKQDLRPAGAKVKSPDNLLEILRPVVKQLVSSLKVFGLSFRFSGLCGSFKVPEVQLDSFATTLSNGWSERHS